MDNKPRCQARASAQLSAIKATLYGHFVAFTFEELNQLEQSSKANRQRCAIMATVHSS